MRTPDIDVVRATRMEVRAADGDGEMPTMEIRFSTFDTWYEVDSFWEGKFLERTQRGAFADTIRDDGPAVKVLYDHGFDPQIGNKVLGSIESLSEEPDSPVGIVPLFDTSYNRDLEPGLRAGAYGSSFRFRVTSESWVDEPEPSDDNPKGLPERTITGVRLFEFGPVTFPANPDATAGLRSMTDQFYDRLRTRDSHAYADAVRTAGVNPADLTGESDARSADRGDTDEPGPEGDPSEPTPEQRRDHDALRLRGVIK
jgi:HK97 family phage prohead protease